MMSRRHWSDAFFGKLYYRFDQLRHSDLAAELRCITNLCGLSRDAKIADVCCGYGRLAVPLAMDSSLTLVGFDKSIQMIRLARLRNREMNSHAIFRCVDLLNQQEQLPFDAAYMFGTSFGYYREDSMNEAILHSVRSILREGSTFILHQTSRPDNLIVTEEDEDYVFHKHSDYDQTTGMYTGVYSYHHKTSGQTFEAPFRIHLYSRFELSRFLHKAGFGSLEFFGDYSLSQFSLESTDLIISAVASEISDENCRTV